MEKSAIQLAKNTRMAGFDAMRAMLALLGIVLHAGISYTVLFQGIHIPWYAFSHQHSLIFNWLVLWIHTFRMPAFFFLSGFFSYLIYKKVNLSGLSVSRIKRIAIPFFVVSLIPVAFVFGMQFFLPAQEHVIGFTDIIHYLNQVGSLWFLYYLFLLDLVCFTLILVFKGVQWTLPGFLEKIKRITKGKIFFGLCILALLAYPVFMMHYSLHWFVRTDITLKPNLGLFLYYGSFFLLGWAVQTRFKSLISFSKNYCYYLLSASLLLSLVYIALFFNFHPHYRTLTLCCYSLMGFAMLLGMMGFCLKKFQKPKRIIQYLADASYWIYLSQIPIIVYVESILTNFNIPVFEKYFIAVSITITVCLLTYQLFIRNRKIFRYIDGNASPRKYKSKALSHSSDASASTT